MGRCGVPPRRWVVAAAAASAVTALTATTCTAGPVGLPRVATSVMNGLPAGWTAAATTVAAETPAVAAPCAAAGAVAPALYPPAGAVADGAGGWVVVPAGAPAAGGAPKGPPPPLPALPLAGTPAPAAPAVVPAGAATPQQAAATPTVPPPTGPVVGAAIPLEGASPTFDVDPVVVETEAPIPPPPAVAPVGALPPPPAATAAPLLPVVPVGGAFIPPPRCPSFPPFNLYTAGAVTLSASEVLGPLACGGNANLTGFSINYNSTCDPTSGALALAVGGVLSASSGQVTNGGISVGIPLPQTVGQVCTRPVVAGAVDFRRITTAAVAASAALCDGPAPVGCVTRTDAGGGVVFDVSAAPPASLAVCNVPAQVLTAATGVTVAGRWSAGTVVAINVEGSGGNPAAAAVRLFGCEFFGFTPATTVLNFCGVARLTVDNVGVPAAVLGPAVALDGPSGHVQGSVVAAAVNTGIEFRNAPFAC